MCLLVVLSRVIPDAPLIVGANRDERLERPAIAMDVLRERDPRTLGGRDGLAGGTWLAVNEHGVVAGLTNRPNPEGRDDSKRSRGELPLALTSRATAEDVVETFLTAYRPSEFNPAWLLVGDRTSLVAVDMTGEAALATPLGAGIHVLENRPYGAPSAKVQHVTSLVGRVDGLAPADAAERLRSVLANHEIPDDLPDDEVDPERPAGIKAACVHTDRDYGTRWSGVIVVPADIATSPQFTYTDGPSCTSPRQEVSWQP